MSDFVPKVFDGLDGRPDASRAASLLSSASASDAEWLRGNVRTQHAGLANDDQFTDYQPGNVHSLRAVPKRVLIEEEDWNSLFGAVEERLQRTVNQPLAAATPAQALEKALAVRDVVLDCVRALDTLLRALKQERAAQRPPAE